MRVTWMGHACFVLEQDGFRIVIDPYTGVPGYPPLVLEADRVECSHGHFDHNAVSAVRLRPGAGTGPFTVEEIPTFHDGAGGALRGGNTVRVFSAGGVRVCHMGDIGHALSPAQAAAVGRCDAVLIPVGGVYTVDAAGAKQIADRLRPRFAVPMHYRHAPYGLENVAGAEKFLRLWPAAAVERLEGNAFDCLPAPGWEETQVLLPKYPV